MKKVGMATVIAIGIWMQTGLGYGQSNTVFNPPGGTSTGGWHVPSNWTSGIPTEFDNAWFTQDRAFNVVATQPAVANGSYVSAGDWIWTSPSGGFYLFDTLHVGYDPDNIDPAKLTINGSITGTGFRVGSTDVQGTLVFANQHSSSFSSDSFVGRIGPGDIRLTNGHHLVVGGTLVMGMGGPGIGEWGDTITVKERAGNCAAPLGLAVSLGAFNPGRRSFLACPGLACDGPSARGLIVP
jgi:hypothetical protein